MGTEGPFKPLAVMRVSRIYKEYPPIPSLLVICPDRLELLSQGLPATALYRAALKSSSKAYKPSCYRIPLNDIEDVSLDAEALPSGDTTPLPASFAITYRVYSMSLQEDDRRTSLDNTAPEDLAQVALSSGDLQTLQLTADTMAAARRLVSVITSSRRRLMGSLQWLDSRLPLASHMTVAMLTVAPGPEPAPEVVVAHRVAWGAWFQLPAAWSTALSGGGTQASELDCEQRLSAYVVTPLGLGRGSLSPAQMVGAAGGDSRWLTLPVSIVGESSEGADPDQATFRVSLQCRLLKRAEPLKGAKCIQLMEDRSTLEAASSSPRPRGPPDPTSEPISTTSDQRSASFPPWGLAAVLAALLAVLLQAASGTEHHSGFSLANVSAMASLAALAGPALMHRFKAGQPAPRTAVLPPPAPGAPSPQQQQQQQQRRAAPPPPEQSGGRWYLSVQQGEVLEGDTRRATCGEDADESGRSLPTPGAEAAVHASQLPSSPATVVMGTPPPASLAAPGAGAAGMPGEENPELLKLVAEASSHVEGVHLSADTAARFLAGEKGNYGKALERLIATLAWRKAEGLEGLLEEGQPHFHAFKAAYPHGILCHSRDGFHVYLEHAGTAKKAYDRCRRAGMGPAVLLRHMLFMTEYTYRRVDPRPLPGGKAYKITDLTGLGLYDFAGEFRKLCTLSFSLYGAHYPETLHKMVLINVPIWFSSLWTMLSPLVDAATKTRIKIYASSSAATRELLKDIRAEDLPVQYGGTSRVALYDTPHEADLNAFVSDLNRRTGTADVTLGK